VYRAYRTASYDLQTMRADGSAVKSIATDLSDDLEPRWSPDGRRIAYVRSCTEPQPCMKLAKNRRDGAGQLYVVAAGGGRQVRLTTGSAAVSDPRWSPDGTRIAFVSTRGADSDVYVVRADGTGLRRLTRAGRVDLGGRWSPDGRRLAFVSTRDGNYEVYVMNADGSRQRNLTRNAAAEQVPAWAPDGRRIFFVSDRDGTDRVYATNVDGSRPTKAASVAATYGDLVVAAR
jgi:Tol biopolymer transport system component